MGVYAERILPWILGRLLTLPHVTEQRLPALATARGRVLEIGFGLGASLAAYPREEQVRDLVGLEPSRGMIRLALHSAGSSPFPVLLVRADARAIPVRDGVFDTVVSNWTLCSIPDPGDALREVRRVLRPGGRFLFVEHGRAEDPRLARWQRRLNPIQRRLAGGCRLDLAVEEVVLAAGFSLDSLERYRGRPGPRLLTQMYRGVARAPGGSGDPS